MKIGPNIEINKDKLAEPGDVKYNASMKDTDKAVKDHLPVRHDVQMVDEKHMMKN